MPPLIPLHDTVTEYIVLGADSLPHPSPSAAARATAAQHKGGETYQQMYRIVDDMRMLAATLGRAVEWCDMLFDAAAVHDLGNLSIPDGILSKTGRLSLQEWRAVRDHPVAAAALLAGTTNPIEALAAEVALSHHEKWDGSGYPAGLQGSSIPLAGRIVAVADFVDSLGTASTYRDALSDEDIFRLLGLASGTHFDPSVVRAMIALRPRLTASGRDCVGRVTRTCDQGSPRLRARRFTKLDLQSVPVPNYRRF